MLGVYDSMKKLIDKCDLYFEGHIISKELLLQNYADFLAGNFEKKHNVVISLHTGSVCFDIVSLLMATVSNILFSQESAEDVVESLEPGSIVTYNNERWIFSGEGEPAVINGANVRTVRLRGEYKSAGMILSRDRDVPQPLWNTIKPYYGQAHTLDGRGLRRDDGVRNEFLTYVFDMESQDIPAFIRKSSVVVMNRERANQILNGLMLIYNKNKKVRLTDICPFSYFTENEEYSYQGNPGRIDEWRCIFQDRKGASRGNACGRCACATFRTIIQTYPYG